jgi:C4-dicarboxylate-specific signal transduction histidine kinase
VTASASTLRLAAHSSALDLHVALRACQTLARARAAEELCITLMSLSLRHTGADGGVLLLRGGGEPALAVHAVDGSVDVRVSRRAVTAEQAPLGLFNGLARVRHSLLLGDPAALPCGAFDPYLYARAPRSAIGVPLLRGGELIGMLYLEHSSTPALFSPARVALLELLATQCAVALEGTYVHQQLRAETLRRGDAEQALCEARTEFARAARITTMGEFAASIAHEVSQPLAAIALHAGAALRWLHQKPAQLEHVHAALETVLCSATRAGEMIRGMHGMARKTAPALAPILVDDTIRDTLLLMAAELRKHDIVLDTALGLVRRQARADRIQLQQVIMNLVLNAIEAMADVGSRRRKLSLRSCVAGGVCAPILRISVADNGAGIDPACAARLFDPLFSTKPGGMGMGLSISRGIVEAHGGRLWCETGAAAGSVFHIDLPVPA